MRTRAQPERDGRPPFRPGEAPPFSASPSSYVSRGLDQPQYRPCATLELQGVIPRDVEHSVEDIKPSVECTCQCGSTTTVKVTVKVEVKLEDGKAEGKRKFVTAEDKMGPKRRRTGADARSPIHVLSDDDDDDWPEIVDKM